MTHYSFGFYVLVFFLIITARYFLMAGGSYWIFYVVLEKFFAHKSWHKQKIFTPDGKSLLHESIYREIKMSVFSAIIFALGAAFIMTKYNQGLTLLYIDLHHYELWYLGFSFVAVLILQDTYFYFLHRLFHNPLLFRWIHLGHHRSLTPTPWTSFAFDLPEAFIQMLFFIGIVFILPLHFFTLIAVLLTMTVSSVWTHLGLEIFPSPFPQHWLGKFLIGSTHHTIHHHQYTVNYGLYFTFWDKLCNTQDSHYQDKFDVVCGEKDKKLVGSSLSRELEKK